MSSRREVVGKQKIALCSILFAAAGIIVISVIFGVIHTQAASAEVSYKYYTSVRILHGDTLWNIAETYFTDDYRSIDEYIEEICQMNHILGSEIHAGQYITIPYYTNDYLE